MPIAVWLLAAALFCFFGERFVLSFWLIIMASVDALLEIVVAKRWPKIGSLLYEIDLTTRNGLVNGTVKLLLTALLCVVAWSLSVLTSPFLEYFADLVAQILRKP